MNWANLPVVIRVTGQNASGQNGIGQNGTDKMAWTKWNNFIFCVDFNSAEFNIYLITKSPKYLLAHTCRGKLKLSKWKRD